MIEKILNEIKAGENVFITGQAGVGKSYSIHKIIEHLEANEEKFAITSSTGISALPLGGTTGHSFFGSGIANSVAEIDSIINTPWWKYTVQRIQEFDIVIIDEISMVSRKLFELWDRLARIAQGIDLPFGGMQVIISGDFLQLPPVIRSGVKASDWVFNSDTWKEMDIKVNILTEVKRQDDAEFVKHLGNVRMGEASQETIDYFYALNREPEVDDITKLVATNNEAKGINIDKLNEIDSEPYKYEAKLTGEKKHKETLIKEVIADEMLELKVGAKVMAVVNDVNKEYVNGSIGHILRLEESYVEVVWDETGKVSTLGYNKWEKKDSRGKVLATFSQVPVKLAYAITMHKSQGMTIEELSVDCTRIFSEGQLYVALSRAKTANKLYLKNFHETNINANPIAKGFYTGEVIEVEEETKTIQPVQIVQEEPQQLVRVSLEQEFDEEEFIEEVVETVEVKNDDEWKFKIMLHDTQKVDWLIERINTIKPDRNLISIDTETTGLDVYKDKPYDIIIGWKIDKVFEGYNVIIESVTKDNWKAKLTEVEQANVDKLIKAVEDKNTVFHNAKFDIAMIQNVTKYNPTKFNDTQILTKHIEKNLKEKQSTALKVLVDYYGIRSSVPELEGLLSQYKKAKTRQDKYQVINNSLSLLPKSGPLIANLNKLKNGEDGEWYFDMLFFAPENLIKFYIKLQNDELEDNWKNDNPDWEMSLINTYKFIKTVYSKGAEFEDAKIRLRKFNAKYLEYKNEWAEPTRYDYVEIYNRDPAALLIYGAMDVKITLDLFDRLMDKAKQYGFMQDKDRMKIVKQDLDTILPLLQQERTGLPINTKKIEEGIEEAKKLLWQINGTIELSMDAISNDDSWKEHINLDVDEALKANNYNKYVAFFNKYVPQFQLPIHTNPKSKNKVDSTLKLCEIYDKWNSIDMELKEQMVKMNGSLEFDAIVGNDKATGFIYNVYSRMIEEAKKIINARTEEIQNAPLKKDGTPRKMDYRKEEKALLEIIDKLPENPSEGIKLLKEASTKTNQVGNAIVKNQSIEWFKVTRTINKKNSHMIYRFDIEKFSKENPEYSQKEISDMYELKKVVKLKATEASLLKWIGVYMIKWLAQYAKSADGRIRTSYMTAGPVTGRLSADIQQNPKKPLKNEVTGEVVYHPRSVFEAQPIEGVNEPIIYAWLDFSQIELRGGAEYTIQYGMPDTNFVQAYIPFECYSKEYGKYDVKLHKLYVKTVNWYYDEEMTEPWVETDLHLLPVRMAFPQYFEEDGVTPKEEHKDLVAALRGATKGVNFGILYGSGLQGILTNPLLAEFSQEALTAIYEAQKESYPQLANWQRTIINQVKNTGRCKNLQGRVYEQGFPEQRNKWGDRVYGEGYKGTNYLIQGEAAGQLKSRMRAVYDYINENNLNSKLLANIHDEIFYAVPLSEIEHIMKFQEIMQDIPWHIPAISDIEVSLTNWAEKHEVKTLEDIKQYIEDNYDQVERQLKALS